MRKYVAGWGEGSGRGVELREVVGDGEKLAQRSAAEDRRTSNGKG
jgi:hypothetical protein